MKATAHTVAAKQFALHNRISNTLALSTPVLLLSGYRVNTCTPKIAFLDFFKP